MRLKSLLPALLPLALLGAGLSACDSRSTSLPTSVQESTPGGFAFRLDSTTLATAKPYADSLRVELRQGTRLRVVAAALDSAVRVNDLESGSWAITVGLYAKDGALKYVGSDTVLVSAGKVAAANVTLRPAKGSVDITIRIDTTGIPDCPPIDTIGPVGTWYLQTVQGKPVVGRSIALILESDGSLSGTDGCNHIAGGWKTQGGSLSLSYAQTLMACESGSPTDNLPLALSRVRGWNRTADQLTLLDSAGAVLATYGTRPMEECATPNGSSPNGTWLLQVIGKDTVYANRYELILKDSSGSYINDSLRLSSPIASFPFPFLGMDGCSVTDGGWNLEGGLQPFSQSQHFKACFDSPADSLAALWSSRINSAIWAARSWKLDTSGNDRHLLLLDSLGKTLAVYGTYVLHPTGALVPKVDQVILVDSIDTAMIPNRVPVALGSVVPSDSGLFLEVTLPHPGVKVHLVDLVTSEPMACNPVTVDTALLPGQVVSWGCIMVLPAGRYALVGETDPGLISPQVLTPARVLVRDLKLDLCGPNARDLTIRDGFGKEISFSPSTVFCATTPAD